ncbi:MAG: glycosyltransferase, partial [Haloplanus sp.]
TPVGMVSSIVEHGETGYLATTDEEWTHYLTRLIEHPELRRSMGEAGYRSLEAKELWLDQRVDDVHHVLDAVTEAN